MQAGIEAVKKQCPEIASAIVVPADMDLQLLPLDGDKLEPNPELQQEIMEKAIRLIDLQ